MQIRKLIVASKQSSHLKVDDKSDIFFFFEIRRQVEVSIVLWFDQTKCKTGNKISFATTFSYYFHCLIRLFMWHNQKDWTVSLFLTPKRDRCWHYPEKYMLITDDSNWIRSSLKITESSNGGKHFRLFYTKYYCITVSSVVVTLLLVKES